ncbi:MAG: hypothetical protein U0L15_00185, partial [Oscillospiraceae bacterium]|nr:hypothetical protein [Oscillospiraceae bacterium]
SFYCAAFAAHRLSAIRNVLTTFFCGFAASHNPCGVIKCSLSILLKTSIKTLRASQQTGVAIPIARRKLPRRFAPRNDMVIDSHTKERNNP